MRRIGLVYILVLVLALAAVAGVLQLGQALPAPPGTSPAAALAPNAAMAADDGASTLAGIAHALGAKLHHPLGQLFVQLLVIIAAAQLLGRAFTRLGQPAVVGEMTAGILLGPSLFGLLAPEAFRFVFPTDSLGTLRLLSQIGVCLFMFAVGMKLNVAHVRDKAHAAVAVSHASIVAPYVLGVLLAYALYSELAAAGSSFTAFALFMGIAMSITAFPVMARILDERGLTRTHLGSTAITCAAVDDITAWSLLAFVVAIAGATSLGGAAVNLVLGLGFVAVMVYAVRPALAMWLGDRRLKQEDPSNGTLAVAVCLVLAAALCTEIIGIHALFGAFLAGAIMPRAQGFGQRITVRVESFSTVLLLPLFFAFTGLRTEIGLIETADDWLLCGLIIAVATLGKLGGSALAARFTGMHWCESLQLGALMNTRGLMELIALNIGYDLGILSPRIFTMMVVMALATTMMTGPLLSLFGARRRTSDEQPARPVQV